MRFIRLDSETDFNGWRKAARSLIGHASVPAEVTWTVRGRDSDLFEPDGEPVPVETAGATFSVPSRFIELGQSVILHRDPERFALLYRMLWRLQSDRDLMAIATDADVARLQAMAKAVHRDQHKMKAFVRFREIDGPPESRFVAWFEPEHHIVEATTPFFVGRFAAMSWSILTPDLCVHWDRQVASFTPGVSKADAPAEDRLEETWRRYYASIFNPARLKVKAMQAEMPKKYWRNLPEARLIAPLIAGAGRATDVMISDPATAPQRMQKRPAMPGLSLPLGDPIEALRAEAAQCRACPLWKDATQTVFGEGPSGARLMLVGEQAGDKEDLAGKPFVGPAGQVLDRALQEAGIARPQVYVTNAVKHFKFVPRGKIRLHQKPNTSEIRTCRQWFDRELKAIKPALVVAMGATAAHSLFGKATPVNASRGRIFDLDTTTQALVTVHPSYLLRLPDPDAQEREYRRFVDDLKLAAAHLLKLERAA